MVKNQKLRELVEEWKKFRNRKSNTRVRFDV
jgi:hypothetical protein